MRDVCCNWMPSVNQTQRRSARRQSASAPATDADKRIKVLAAIIATVAFVIYINCYQGAFVLDDRGASILRNPTFHNLGNLWGVLSPPSDATVTCRPLLNVSLAINYAIERGNSTVSYHLFNVVIHILNGLVLFGVIRRTLAGPRMSEHFGTQATTLAFVCALVWVTHPICTSCVTYIVQRAESLMTLFLLLTLYCTIRSDQDAEDRERWIFRAVVACALGMTSKEVMAVAPLIVVCYDWVFGHQEFRKTLRERSRLYIALLITWVFLAAAISTGSRGSIKFDRVYDVTSFDYAKTQMQIVLHYLRLAVWPHPLVFDYDWPIVRKPAEWLPFLPFVLALGIGSFVALWWRRPIGFLGALFCIILGPSSSFLVIFKEVAAEHRMYLPLVSVIIVLVMGVTHIGNTLARSFGLRSTTTSKLGWLLVLIVAGTFSLLTFNRNFIYHDRLRLWKDTAESAPNGARPQYNLGILYGNRSDKLRKSATESDAAGRHEDADQERRESDEFYKKMFEQFEKAIAIKENYPNVYVSLGDEYQSQGELDRAIKSYRKALSIEYFRELNSPAHNKLGQALVKRGNYQEAIGCFRKAFEIEPRYVPARLNLANAYIHIGVYGSAKKVLEIAVAQFRYRPAVQRLAAVLALAPDEAIRDGKAALEFAQALVQQSQGKDAGDLETLAAALAETGDFLKAAKIAKEMEENYRKNNNDRHEIMSLRKRAYRSKRTVYWESPAS